MRTEYFVTVNNFVILRSGTICTLYQTRIIYVIKSSIYKKFDFFYRMWMIISGLAGAVGALYLFVKFKIPWLLGDLKFMKYIFNVGFILAKNQKNNILPIDVFEKMADKYRDKTMIIYKDTSYSYAEVDRMANKIANVALGLGLKQGDTVAMLMYSEPTFIWTWLGL